MSLSNEEDSKNQDNLSIFCREVRNLLRSKPNCMIPFSKFVPAYHNHYGRQCCVYQFGFTKLIELLESIPHVVKIVGDGSNRYITLTHREQIKRFASDLIKVVKSQPGKKLKLSKFSQAYEQVLGRKFRVEDYGTNDINVLLSEIWEGTINIIPIRKEKSSVDSPLFVKENCLNELVNKPYITEEYPDAWFEIPKRERSEKEIKRTKYFIWDVIELLSNMEPDYSVPFSKFIPSYHYYFNRQCKVSIFGFSKLIDLFESISPDTVEIMDQGAGEEKIIKLANQHIRGISRTRHQQNHSRNIKSIASNRNGFRDNRSGSYSPACADDEDEDEDEEDEDVEDEEVDADDEIEHVFGVQEDDEEEEEIEVDEEEEYDDDETSSEDGDDIILPLQAIDSGPSEKELEELEDELSAYEDIKALQTKRSSRMAAMLDIFKYSIY